MQRVGQGGCGTGLDDAGEVGRSVEVLEVLEVVSVDLDAELGWKVEEACAWAWSGGCHEW